MAKNGQGASEKSHFVSPFDIDDTKGQRRSSGTGCEVENYPPFTNSNLIIKPKGPSTRPIVSPNKRLEEMRISVIPYAGYPPGFDPLNVVNYEEIADAFSHVLYPGLFESIDEPFPENYPWYDDLFKNIQDPFPVLVTNSNLGHVGCLGEVGLTDGRSIAIRDCSDREVILHEIGHIIHRKGIEARLTPFHYFLMWNNQWIDSLTLFNQIFGDFTETRKDSDGTTIGFFTSYAEKNPFENFAEHFAAYVYYGSSLRRKARNQQAFNSTLLGLKIRYIQRLFLNLVFEDGGRVSSWLGFNI